jgi:ribosomal protein S18 acetylase RimI-like enzyme
MGYAMRAFEQLEAAVSSRGLCGIALHVFGHNEAARALYAKLGYRATNISMFKRVLEPGA